jgi:hypothetical protein
VYVGVDVVEEEVGEHIRTGGSEALQLASLALSVEVGEHKERHRGESKVVGVDVHQPTIPVWSILL